MARGLSRAEAERLIVRGFFQDVLDRIELEPVREALGAALEARIHRRRLVFSHDFRQKLVLAVCGGSGLVRRRRGLAATHGASHPAKKPPVRMCTACSRTCTIPCHNRGAKITSAQL